MKDAEDEAFDDLAKRQGMWGGGFQAKRAMAAAKLQDGKCKLCIGGCAACDARAQPAQELIYKITVIDDAHPKGIPFEDWVQPTQREWVGLTDEEVMEMMGYDKQYGHIPQYARNFVAAISAKLKEKNT